LSGGRDTYATWLKVSEAMPQNSILKLRISFLVWEIHKSIAGDVGSNVGA